MRPLIRHLAAATAAAVLVALLSATGVAHAAAPANDAFGFATPLPASGSLTASNVDATTQAGEPNPANTNNGVADHSVWWTWTAPASGTLVVSTLGSSFETVLGIYSGTSLAGLTLRGEADDTGIYDQGRAQAAVTAGQTYRLLVAGWGPSDVGTIRLAWRLAQRPANDDFGTSQVLSGASVVASGTNVASTAQVNEPAHGGDPAQHSVWYRWTSPSTGLAYVDALGDFDLTVAVYTGGSVGGLTLRESSRGGQRNDKVRLAIDVTQGVTYQIVVSGFDARHDEIGSFSVGVNRRTFADVPRSHPFFDAIEWVNAIEVTTGYPDGTYRPSSPISRAAMSAFLLRYDSPDGGSFVAPATPSFSDVPTSHPFFREVEWLADIGLSTGYEDGTFRPQASVSRAAMSAYLFRYAGFGSYVPPATPSFSDVPTSHPFYREVEWLASRGIATGYADGTFGPAAPISRGAMAVFLQRFSAQF